MATEAKLAELLASRLCHDLSGPIGVAADAEDLIGGDAGIDADGAALVAESARLAAARLAFFRAAFGYGGETGRGLPIADVAALTDAALASSRCRFSFAAAGATGEAALPAALTRLCLCLALLAAEALPRGGLISVGIADSGAGLTLVAAGRGARLPEPMLAALAATDCRDLTARTVVGFYARTLADRLGGTLKVVNDGDQVCLAMETPVTSALASAC